MRPAHGCLIVPKRAGAQGSGSALRVSGRAGRTSGKRGSGAPPRTTAVRNECRIFRRSSTYSRKPGSTRRLWKGTRRSRLPLVTSGLSTKHQCPMISWTSEVKSRHDPRRPGARCEPGTWSPGDARRLPELFVSRRTPRLLPAAHTISPRAPLRLTNLPRPSVERFLELLCRPKVIHVM
jgi:hypothetical protein